MMKKKDLHPNTAAMLRAWLRITKTPGAVDSGPSAYEFPELLGRLFVIETTRSGFTSFRIAGEGLTRFLGQNLVGTDFLDLWKSSDHDLLTAFLNCVTKGDSPGILRAVGETNLGRHSEVEIALAPLSTQKMGGRRMLGLYQSLGGEAMILKSNLRTHLVRSIELPYPDFQSPSLKLVASND